MAASSSKPDKDVQWIDAAQTRNPQIAQQLAQFADLCDRRLWHQLTVALEETIEQPAFQKAANFLPELYSNFVKGFAFRLNPLRLARIAVSVSKHYDKSEEGSESQLQVLAVRWSFKLLEINTR